jgi:putative ABC transport system permease protein
MKPWFRKRMSAAIGLLGLVISFSVFIILMAQVWYDVSFDRSWPGSSRIYTFERPQSYLGDSDPYRATFNRPQIQTLREASPGVEAVGTLGETHLFDPQTNEPLRDLPTGLIDTDFLRVFPPEIIAGTTDGFDRPDALILTETAARRLFGGAGPAVGQQVMRMGMNRPEPATVVCVCRDLPVNSVLAVFGAFAQIGDRYATDNNPNYEALHAFLLLGKGVSPKEITPVLAAAFEKNLVLWEDEDTVPDIRERTRKESRLVRLHDVHYNPFRNGTGNRTRDAVLTTIALLFLLVGLLNVFNLSMAGLPFRIKDGCIRMIFGAGKEVLLRRDLVNAVLLCLFSFALAIVVLLIVGTSPLASFLSVPLRPGTLMPVLAFCLAVALTGSFLAAYIPSRYGASFAPGTALKGRISLSGRGKEFRTGTLAFQYLLSYVFVAMGMMIGVQNRFVSNFDLGFRTRDIIYAYMGVETSGKYEAVREELLKDPDITEVTFSNVPLLDNSPRMQIREAAGGTVRFVGLDVTPDFLDFFGFKIKEGRSFTDEDGRSTTGRFIVNEAFMRAYPGAGLGTSMKGIRTGRADEDAEIVGVVKDFHFQDLKHPVEPYAFYCSGGSGTSNGMPRYFRVAVKTVSGKAGAVAGNLPSRLEAFSSGEGGARCELLSETARNFYRDNERESGLVNVSSLLSLLLALLGIFGLIYLEVETIRKSLAIRKLLGATTPELLWTLLRKYLILGSLIFVASIPLSVWIIDRWRGQFAEQAPVPVWIFLLTWVLVLGMTSAVISTMSFTILNTNPAEELKKE